MGSNSARDYTTSGSLAGASAGQLASREDTRGATRESGGHSWGPTREATESGAHSWGATQPEMTLPPEASREILGETSQVGGTLVGEKPSRGDTRGRQLRNFFFFTFWTRARPGRNQCTSYKNHQEPPIAFAVGGTMILPTAILNL